MATEKDANLACVCDQYDRDATFDCPVHGTNFERQAKRAILGLAGAMAAADDQARAMTDEELGRLLTTGRWTTIEVFEAGLRLLGHREPSLEERRDA